jgi:uncharacterized protein YycO
MARVERFGPGQTATELTPGDFMLAHRHRPLAGLISLAERRRFTGADAPFAHWSHAAIVAEDATVIEAETLGVVRSPIGRYRDDEYHVVRLDGELDDAARARVMAYADSRIGEAFGYLDLAGTGVYLLTGLPMRLVRKQHEICSSLVVRALQRGGLLMELDPAVTLPADLAKRFGVRP